MEKNAMVSVRYRGSNEQDLVIRMSSKDDETVTIPINSETAGTILQLLNPARAA